LNTAGSIAGAVGAVEAPGTELVLEYKAGPPASLKLISQRSTDEKSRNTNTSNTAMDPDKFIFGINANAGGILGTLLGRYGVFGGSGAGINIELGKGRFNAEINLMLTSPGFGLLATFNYFWPSRIGGFYLGGGTGFSFYEKRYRRYYYNSYYGNSSYTYYGTALSLPLGLNIGYKFVTRSGLYFRTGAFFGYDFLGLMYDSIPIYLKPDLAIGWTMR
jgi:hypothetical protein